MTALAARTKKLESILRENEELRKQMASQRSRNAQTREFHIDNISEAQTRKKYIDVALKESFSASGVREIIYRNNCQEK